MLDPDAVLHIDAAARIAAPASEAGQPRELRGASTWARQFLALSRALHSVQPALIGESAGLIVAPRGKLSRVLIFTVADGKVTRIDVVAEPARLRELEIAVP